MQQKRAESNETKYIHAPPRSLGTLHPMGELKAAHLNHVEVSVSHKVGHGIINSQETAAEPELISQDLITML